jgi:hypothetical protein
MCCTLIVESTSIFACSSSCYILPALGVPAAFDVGMRQLVDQHDLRFAPRMASMSISSNGTPRYSILPPRHHLHLFDQLRRAWPAMRLDHTHDDILAALLAPDRLAQHAVGLAHARRVAQKQLQRSARLLGVGVRQPFLGVLGIAEDSSLQSIMSTMQKRFLVKIIPYIAASAHARLIVYVYYHLSTSTPPRSR